MNTSNFSEHLYWFFGLGFPLKTDVRHKSVRDGMRELQGNISGAQISDVKNVRCKIVRLFTPDIFTTDIVTSAPALLPQIFLPLKLYFVLPGTEFPHYSSFYFYNSSVFTIMYHIYLTFMPYVIGINCIYWIYLKGLGRHRSIFLKVRNSQSQMSYTSGFMTQKIT